MIVLGRESIIVEHSFLEAIPGAKPYGIEYLKKVRRGIQSLGLPVIQDVDEVKGSGVSQRTCLKVTPTDRRLSHYPMLHFGVALGDALQVGYYLVGGDRAAGGDLWTGQTFGIGRPTDADVDNVLLIVQMVLERTVAPAIQEIADMAVGGSQRRGGFFGT